MPSRVVMYGEVGRTGKTWTDSNYDEVTGQWSQPIYKAEVRLQDGSLCHGPAQGGVGSLNVVMWDGQMWIPMPSGTTLPDSWRGRREPTSVEAEAIVSADMPMRVRRAGVS